MRAAIALVVASLATAHADDTTSIREVSVLHPGDEPLLQLDPVWRPNLALDAPLDTQRVVYALGERTVIALERENWSYDNGMTGDGAGGTFRLSHDFGPVRIGAYASYQALSTRAVSGSYVDLGLSVGRTFKLSRWMTAWIALSVSQRYWLDEPPEYEENATTFMLSVGTTFR